MKKMKRQASDGEKIFAYHILDKCCCSVANLCLTLCHFMGCSSPGPLSSTISQSLLKFMSIERVMLSNHLILWFSDKGFVSRYIEKSIFMLTISKIEPNFIYLFIYFFEPNFKKGKNTWIDTFQQKIGMAEKHRRRCSLSSLGKMHF